MNLTANILPPFIFSLIRDFLPVSLKSRGDYINFNHALTHCKNQSYENEDLVNIIYEKTLLWKKKLQNEDKIILDYNNLQILSSILIASTNNNINLLDFGGSFGTHYFLLKYFLNKINKNLLFSWNIIENSTIVRKSKILSTQDLKFFNSINEINYSDNVFDLVIISGVLQYLPEPFKYLDEIINTKSKYILINRIPLFDNNKSKIAVQHSNLSMNGPGELPPGIKDIRIKYPIHLLPKSLILEYLSANYVLITTFIDNKRKYYYKSKALNIYGFLFKLH